MATPQVILQRFSDTVTLSNVIAAVLLLYVCSLLPSFFQQRSALPWINYKKSQWTYFPAKLQYVAGARKLIAQGFQKFSGPFNIVNESGPLIMLPPDYIDAVDQEPNLDFDALIFKQFHTEYATFQGLRPQPGVHTFQDAVTKGLTRSLPKFTKPLSDEMEQCLIGTWTDSPEWHEINPREDVLTWVARLSSRIFYEDKLASNEELLRVAREYTVKIFKAIEVIKMVPPPFRWLAERTLPLCRSVRADYNTCTRILTPILAERKAEIEAAQREGREPELPDDSIEWFRKASKGRPYNDYHFQLSLGTAAIHTTSDLLGQAILNLSAHPEMVEPIRQEAIEVLKKHGWKKLALAELYILDSFLKESQRLKPFSFTSMNRLALDDVELPNGIRVHKGEKIAISRHRMWSEEHYENAEEFDGYRFLKRRESPGFKFKSGLTMTSYDHTGFGHGKHACPGRFFAAQEIKIAMVHVVLKYDIEIKDPATAKWVEFGSYLFVNPKARLMVRRRKEEIDLDSLGTNAELSEVVSGDSLVTE